MPDPKNSTSTVFSIRGVSFRYPGGGFLRSTGASPLVLQDVSLGLRDGESLGLVGESGSGKSTLAQLLLGLHEPTSGTITYRGKPLAETLHRAPRAFYRDVQFIFQDPASSLNPRVTVRTLLERPLRELLGMDATARRERIAELIELTRLREDFLDRHPHEFSGGQAQRIAIARALAPKPSILLMDEPVSALDVSVQARILNLLRDLRKQLGLTYLFISHDLAVVEYLCERITVLKEGKVVESGPREAILRHPDKDYTRRLIESVYSVSAKAHQR